MFGVYLEYLKASNVKDSDEEVSACFCVQSLVHPLHQPPKHPLIHGLRQSSYGETNLYTEMCVCVCYQDIPMSISPVDN